MIMLIVMRCLTLVLRFATWLRPVDPEDEWSAHWLP